MEFWWFLVGGFGVMVVTYLLIIRYMRRHEGVQPGYAGLVIAAISMACVLAAFYVLQRVGVDMRSKQPREMFWAGLAVLWLVLAAVTAYQRRSSGTVVMDLGPNPMFKLQSGLAVLMVALAISFTVSGDRAQAFSYATWAMWLMVMARGRLQVRERGIIASTFLSWKRIRGCAAISEDKVRLELNNRLQRKLDLKLPAERIEEYVQLVRRGAGEKRLGGPLQYKQ
jgi:hypothetical protein